MRIVARSIIPLFILCAGCAMEQPSTTADQQPSSVAIDLLSDVTDVEGKLVGLAREMNQRQYAWRPGTGVRSVGEVFLHVAADNYVLPAMLGTAAPAGTGVTADYQTAVAFEQRTLPRDSVIAELERSFAHLKSALTGVTHGRMADSVAFFGSQASVQKVWVATTTHLHEHLGQSIAYARSNGVVPPWSRGGN
ncbi:MAG TPA: DinB family protein [Gemmatimonadales bacterium]